MVEAILQQEERIVLGRDEFHTLGIVSYLTNKELVGNYESSNRGCTRVDTYSLKSGGSVTIDYHPSLNTSSLIFSQGVPIQIAEDLKVIAQKTRGGHTTSSNN